MKPEDLIPIVLSFLSLAVSAITAYQTIYRKFSGKVWPGNYIALTYVNDFPSFVLVCFFENTGAKIGILDDLQLKVEHRESGQAFKFFPIVMSDNYNVFKQYENDDWRAFSGVVLHPNSRFEKYVAFRPPVSSHFVAQKGHYELTLQRRWYGKPDWEDIEIFLPFDLRDEDVNEWMQKKALQIATANVQNLR